MKTSAAIWARFYEASWGRAGKHRDRVTVVSKATWIVLVGALVSAGVRLEALAEINTVTLQCRASLLVSGGADGVLVSTRVASAAFEDCSRALDELASEFAPGATPDLVRRWQIRAAIARGELEPALALVRDGQRQHPEDTWYSFMAGLIHHAGRDYRAAARAWSDADPSGRALQGIGARLVTMGKPDLAAEYAREVVRQHPSSAAHLRLAESLFFAGHAAEALEHYAAGFANPPAPGSLDLGEAAYHRAQLLTAQKQYREAIAVLQQALVWRPEYPPYLGYLGRLYSVVGDYANAERWFTETARIAPDSGYAYWEYGQYYLRRQMHEQALTWFQKAVEVEADAPSYIWGDLGGAYLAVGDYDRAIASLEEAVRRDGNNPTYRMWLNDAKQRKRG